MTRKRIQAGAMAASSVAVAKQIALRDTLPLGLPSLYRPAALNDLPRLFSAQHETWHQRVARVSAAALVYSVNKSTMQHAARILDGRERAVLEDLHRYRQPFKKDRTCAHCRLLYGTLYNDRPSSPMAVVNHKARVDVSFDPDTNVSTARIDNFQMIVPKMIAERMIDLAHPLHWSKAPGAFFRETVPVESDGTRLDDVNNKMAAERAWQRTAEQQAFIFEDVVFPINEDISAEIQNILAVSGFRASKDEKRLALRYDYALRRCVRSNFGIVWERSGLDIDGGTYDALAIPIAHLSSDCVTLADKAEQGKIPLGTADAQPRNITELRSGPWASPEDAKATAKLDPYSRTRVDSVEEPLAAIRRVARQLETTTSLGEFYLVNVTASKTLHFTIPANGPIELWHLLTLTAPAFLFTFLNQAICLGPHILFDALIAARHTGEASHATP